MSRVMNNNSNLNHTLSNNLNKTNYSKTSKLSSLESRRKSSFYRIKTYASNNQGKSRLYKVQFGSGNDRIKNNEEFGNNEITTTKYNILTFLPKNLIYQFTRASNIYFLIVSILTFMSFSPKEPASMIGTFVFVLFCTLMKDGIEDLGRYQQDRIANNRLAYKYIDYEWKKEKCFLLRPGDFVKIEKDEEFSCDVLIFKSSNNNGYLYVDTKNLDGETTLKEKCSLEDLKDITNSVDEFQDAKGELETTVSDSNLNEWEGVLSYNSFSDIYCCIKNLVLKGSKLKNTESVYGLVVYAGHNTKIMKNTKNPKPKTSKIMKTLNWILYTLLVFTLVICIVFAVLNVVYTDKNALKYTYIFHKYDPNDKSNHWGVRFGLNFLIFFIAYSQIIPISLYVVMEMIKIFQGVLMTYDYEIYDPELKKPAICRATDLIEELGQIDFIFSDKTGTLTKNEMVFKKCFINRKIYGAENDTNDIETAKNTINGDFCAYERLIKFTDNQDDKNDQEKINIFFILLTVCHDVFPEKIDNKIIYQGSSPDDIALVKGAQQLGYEFISKDFNNLLIKNEITNEEIEYEILCLIPFTSERKRMSVVVKEKSTGKFYVFSKGSDATLLHNQHNQSIISQYSTETEAKDVLNILECFSQEGLRILVMGYKELTSDFIEQWIVKHDQARMKSQEILNNVYTELENNLIFLGCSAIEDKLQDGVPDTIKILLNCNIKIWVLTGDKQNTAEQIGRQCRLITTDMTLIDLTVESSQKEDLKNLLCKLITKYELSSFVNKKKVDIDIFTNEILSEGVEHNISMIIDGVCLEHIMHDKLLYRMFFLLGLIAKSVICCRVTPKQKSQVVRLVKANGDFITLAIGDGANDVPMILEASIGVGIQGKEGTQAVRSADYSIGQFRFLEKLILFYGRNGYIKISKYICYYFYKNILLVITELCFAFYDGFSGQIFFADWLGTMFNAIFTSWPCFFTFAFEKEHTTVICKKFPILYLAGPKNAYFNLKVFWTYIIYGIIHSLLCFYIPAFCMEGILNDKGMTMNHWRISTVSFCCVIHLVSFKLMLISEFWNVLSISLSLVSVAFYYIILVLLCTDFFGKIFQNELIGVAVDILTDFKSLIIIIIVPFLISMPDIVLKQIYYIFFPSPSEYLYKYRMSEEFKNILAKEENYKASKLSSIVDVSKRHTTNLKQFNTITNESNNPLKNIITKINKSPIDLLNNNQKEDDKKDDCQINRKQFKEQTICPDAYETINKPHNDIDDLQYDTLNKIEYDKDKQFNDHRSENDAVTNEQEKYDVPDLYPCNSHNHKKCQLKCTKT